MAEFKSGSGVLLRGGAAAVVGVLLLLAALWFGMRELSLGGRVGAGPAGAGGEATLRLPFRGDNRVIHSVAGVSHEVMRRQLRARGGQTVTVDYRATVRDGRLVVTAQGVGLRGAGEVWRLNLKEDQAGATSFRIPDSGRYDLVFSMWGFGGDFDVSWSVR